MDELKLDADKFHDNQKLVKDNINLIKFALKDNFA